MQWSTSVLYIQICVKELRPLYKSLVLVSKIETILNNSNNKQIDGDNSLDGFSDSDSRRSISFNESTESEVNVVIAESQLENIDPNKNPNDTKLLTQNYKDEDSLAIYDENLRRIIAVLRWRLLEQNQNSCQDLLAQWSIQVANKADIQHMAITSVVMGDLIIPGCFMD